MLCTYLSVCPKHAELQLFSASIPVSIYLDSRTQAYTNSHKLTHTVDLTLRLTDQNSVQLPTNPRNSPTGSPRTYIAFVILFKPAKSWICYQRCHSFHQPLRFFPDPQRIKLSPEHKPEYVKTGVIRDWQQQWLPVIRRGRREKASRCTAPDGTSGMSETVYWRNATDRWWINYE